MCVCVCVCLLRRNPLGPPHQHTRLDFMAGRLGPRVGGRAGGSAACVCVCVCVLEPYLAAVQAIQTPFSMARVAMTGTAAADPVADGAGAQAPATVVPPGMRSGRWNSSDRAQLEDAVSVARLFGASCVRVIRPGYATIEVDLKHEKAAGDRESVQAAERSYIERTAPKKKEPTKEQLAARAASCSLVGSFFFGAVRSMYERSAACTDSRSPAAFSCFRSTSMVA